MSCKYDWQYNEMKQVGTDYRDIKHVKKYDNKMLKFRNYKAEAESIINLTNLKKNHTVIDLGAGTGAFSIEAAPYCKMIYAVDVSSTMLAIIKQKAKENGIKNIKYINAGFLTYKHAGALADLIITKAALHHLPDFWKMVAFSRMNKMLKKGGILFLSDVIFSFPIDKYPEYFNKMVNNAKKNVDSKFAKEAAIHLKEEFSTFDWIIDGMLKRTNFKIKKKINRDKTFFDYICTKVS